MSEDKLYIYIASLVVGMLMIYITNKSDLVFYKIYGLNSQIEAAVVKNNWPVSSNIIHYEFNISAKKYENTRRIHSETKTSKNIENIGKILVHYDKSDPEINYADGEDMSIFRYSAIQFFFAIFSILNGLWGIYNYCIGRDIIWLYGRCKD